MASLFGVDDFDEDVAGRDGLAGLHLQVLDHAAAVGVDGVDRRAGLAERRGDLAEAGAIEILDDENAHVVSTYRL